MVAKTKMIILAGLLAVSLLTISGGQYVQAVSIEIPPEVEVKNEWITLGEIAEIEDISGDKLKNISSLRLGRALHPGYTRTIPREQIVLMLINKGFKKEELELSIPDLIRVKTASQIISREKLQAAAEDYIIKNLDYSRRKIRIIADYNQRELVLPEGDYRLEFSPPFNDSFIGDISLACRIVVNGREYRKIYLNQEVRIKEKVYIAKRRINHGEYLNRQDFKLELKEVSKLKGELITDFNNSLIKDGKVGVPISAGEVLSSYHLYLPDIISPGDKVQAEVVSDNIIVRTEVKAVQSGKKGEYIIVENINSGYRFKARIVNAHLVRISR